MKVGHIIEITKGRLLSGDAGADIKLSAVSTDSRSIMRGSFFIALKGPKFDGADFLDEVFRKGACGALVTAGSKAAGCRNKIVIEVEDTTKALQDIAYYHRMSFDIPVIAVTGSNGKTTTKEMIWQVLSSRYNVLKNEGTKNNHIGVPQTLLQLTKSHDMCVLELGTNHKGEIRTLSAIARPSVAVITNIGPSHLEFFRDLEGVFEAKSEILDYLDRKGMLIINGDDPFLARLADSGFAVTRVGLGPNNDYRAVDIAAKKNGVDFLLNGQEHFSLPVLGTHNVFNALAAMAVARSFRIPYATIRAALRRYAPASMRLNLKRAGGIDIIDDCYNSNPLSMKSALEALMAYPANKRWVVSGDMLELGSAAAQLHRRLGEEMAAADIGGLLTFGELSRHTFEAANAAGMAGRILQHCSDHDEMARILRSHARKGDVILVKGSRGMKMELVIEKLKGKD